MIERALWLVCLINCGGVNGTVERVRDGDTIVMTSGEVIRYLEMNAPELDECYGDVARGANASLVVARHAELTGDTRATDVYGRTLAYVTVNGRDVGAWLLQHGYARLDIIPPDVAREDEYRSLEEDARSAAAGLWSACP